MINIAHKFKYALAFASGAFCVGLLQVTPLEASTTSLSGSCVGVWNSSTWGWVPNSGASLEYNAIDVINFDTRSSQVIVNSVKAPANGSIRPTYTQGEVEGSPFRIEAGPMNGVYKIVFTDGSAPGKISDDYILMAPANSGNTIFMVDTRNGSTGVCQKI